jgi:threonine/homoserine/homoserine lactone efflux protein
MFPALLKIWFLHSAALVTPGANVLLVSQLAASGDRRAAVYAALGVTIGAGIWCSAAVLGVSALFTRIPALRLALQVAGAIYLIHIGSRIWRAHAPATNQASRLARGRSLQAGLLTNLSNPKAALFFGSIFTSALPGDPGVALLVASIGLVVANALGWHLLLAILLSGREMQRVHASRRDAVSRVAGAVVGAFGLSLLATAIAGLLPGP